MIRSRLNHAGAPHLSPLAGRGRIASAIRVRGSLRKRYCDGFKHAGHVGQDIIVPEPQNAVGRVALTVRMLPSVHLNNKTPLPANQINRERVDRLLSDEFEPLEPSRSKVVPQSRFGVCRLLPQIPGTLGPDFFGTSHVEIPPHPPRSERCFASPRARRPLPAGGERLAVSQPA